MGLGGAMSALTQGTAEPEAFQSKGGYLRLGV